MATTKRYDVKDLALAGEGKLRAYRHEGVWLTVNTPKDLGRAERFMEEHPEWKPRRRLS